MNKNKLLFGLVMLLALGSYSIIYYAFFNIPGCSSSEIIKTLDDLVKTDLVKHRYFTAKEKFIDIKESSFEEGVRTCKATLVLTDENGLEETAPRKYDIRKSKSLGYYDINLY